MTERDKLTDPSEVPIHETEEDEVRFWKDYELTEQYLSKAEAPPEDELPPRTKPISVRLGEDMIQRLKALADIKHKGYQTLLKEFVLERLREEEKGGMPSRWAELGGAYQRHNEELQAQLTRYELQIKEQSKSLALQAQQIDVLQEQVKTLRSSYGAGAQEAGLLGFVGAVSDIPSRIAARAEEPTVLGAVRAAAVTGDKVDEADLETAAKARNASVAKEAVRVVQEKLWGGIKLISH